MKQEHTPLKVMIAGAIAVTAFAITGTSASAQTTTSTATETSTSLSTETATATAAKKPSGTATPQMISEAVQRSQARTEKLRTTGKPEQFGSEEPFTFDPTK
jgi:hypothetical protein